jgi:aspartyl-tRNA(Asn)/glutamyl-tRNA(Gln) amidotransferase subunit B
LSVNRIMRSPGDAMEYVKTLRAQLRYTGSAECSLEQGTLRVDANISLRPCGSGEFNTKVEVKNMNSIRSVGDAIAYEIVRQTECLGRGEPIVLHTRLWDPDKRVTVPMRGKFEGPCIPDPSVACIAVSQSWLERVRKQLPEMPAQKTVRLMRNYGLTPDEAAAMSAERDIAEFFEAVTRHDLPARKVAGWISGHLVPLLRERGQAIGQTGLNPDQFAALIAMLENQVINTQAARDVLPQLIEPDARLEEIVEKGRFRQLSNAAELEALIDQTLAAHPADVQDFRNGNAKVLGFLMGQAMKISRGKANPKLLKGDRAVPHAQLQAPGTGQPLHFQGPEQVHHVRQVHSGGSRAGGRGGHRLQSARIRIAAVHLEQQGLEQSQCTFCGTCLSMCPTGALSPAGSDPMWARRSVKPCRSAASAVWAAPSPWASTATAW